MCTVPAHTPLEEQLVREALAMASYALASGKTLPVDVVEVLQCSLIASAQFATSVASCTDRCAEVGALSWRTQSSHGSLLPRPRAPSCCWPSSLEAAVAGASSARYVWCAACWCWRWHRWWVCWRSGDRIRDPAGYASRGPGRLVIVDQRRLPVVRGEHWRKLLCPLSDQSVHRDDHARP